MTSLLTTVKTPVSLWTDTTTTSKHYVVFAPDTTTTGDLLRKDLDIGPLGQFDEIDVEAQTRGYESTKVGRAFLLGFKRTWAPHPNHRIDPYTYEWQDKITPQQQSKWKTPEGVTVHHVFNMRGDDNWYGRHHDWVLQITTPSQTERINVVVAAWIAETCFGVVFDSDCSFKWNGKEVGKYWGKPKDLIYSYRYDDGSLPTFSEMNRLHQLGPVSQVNALEHTFSGIEEYAARVHGRKKPGLSKIYKSHLKDFIDELTKKRDWISLTKMADLFANSGRTFEKVKVSKVLNEEFSSLKTVEDLQTFLRGFTQRVDPFLETLPSYRGFRKAEIKKGADRALVKIFDELEEMPFTVETHPLLHKATSDGDLPINIFFPHDKGETYFLINDQFDMWEEMLSKHYEITCQIASEASRRKHYEKDLMSYFYFVLYGLPEYLQKHTGKSWTCSPRLVENEYELEPEAQEEDRGVIKKRSALTPVADNQNNHVVVPYVSMALAGRQTTYCYSHEFHLLERGKTWEGHVVMHDLQEKLNGKDDYGLMFYTLTGSYTARGYPSFLIIFERLNQRNKTRVHFHRVHPMRSKQGDQNPISNWTKVCYNWMIGNVNKDRIAFQQGDLAFIRIDTAKQDKVDMSQASKVTSYDSHAFKEPVAFLPYDGNIKHLLGHVEFQGSNVLTHPEHDDVPFHEEGIFEVRQCRSWEANPKGIWTLNFD